MRRRFPFWRVNDTVGGTRAITFVPTVAVLDTVTSTDSPPRTFYVVALVVALAARDRVDLLVPYRDVRTMAGTVIGCRQLARPV